MEVPAQGKGPDQGVARALRVTSFSVLQDPVAFDLRKTRLHAWILKENERLGRQVEAIICAPGDVQYFKVVSAVPLKLQTFSLPLLLLHILIQASGRKKCE